MIKKKKMLEMKNTQEFILNRRVCLMKLEYTGIFLER